MVTQGKNITLKNLTVILSIWNILYKAHKINYKTGTHHALPLVFM
jgi:hypothetical protein